MTDLPQYDGGCSEPPYKTLEEIAQEKFAEHRRDVIESCQRLAMAVCEKRHMKDYPLTIATLICNELEKLKA